MNDEITHEGAAPELDEGAGEAPAQDGSRPRVSRRHLLQAGAATGLAAATAAVAIVPGPPGVGEAAPDATISLAQIGTFQSKVPTSISGFAVLNPLEIDVIAAAAERIIPKDANGPGATDAGVVYFIDRALGSDYGTTGKRYSSGPWTAGTATQGDQNGLSMRDRYRVGTRGMNDYTQKLYQKAFKDLAPDQQDRVLRDMESGAAGIFSGGTGQAGIAAQAFFTLLMAHVKAGFFADPIYGGNREMAGWKLIGYPGAQMNYRDFISRYGEKFTGEYKSIADAQTDIHSH